MIKIIPDADSERGESFIHSPISREQLKQVVDSYREQRSKRKLKKKPYNNNGICTYCEEQFALKDDNLCQGCRDMIDNKSRGFII